MQQNVENLLPTPPRKPFNYADFKWGRMAMHPLLFTKRQRYYAFGGTFTSNNLLLDIDRDAYFLCEGIQIAKAQSWSGASSMQDRTLNIKDLSYDKSWSNLPFLVNDLTGLGANPKYLSDPILIKPSTRLQLTVSGTVNSDNKWYVMLFGRKVYDVTDQDWFTWNKKHWYTYVMNFPQLPAGGEEIIVQTPVFSEADFVLKRVLGTRIIDATFTQSIAAATDVNPIFNIRFTAVDKNLQNKKVSVLINTGFMKGIANTDTQGANTFISETFGKGFPTHPWVKIPRNTIIEMRISNPNPTETFPSNTIEFEGIHVYD